MNCNVTFEQENQKLIVEFTVDETGELTYKPHFEPQVDNKTQLGLLGFLAEKFIDSLHRQDENSEN